MKNLRNDLIAKGLEQIKKFSWEKCAKEHWNYFEELTLLNKSAVAD